jgi:hypothetical protein
MSQPPPLHFPQEYLAQRPAHDVPIPTDRAPPRRQPTRGRSQSNAANLRRAKTLTRPERGVAPAPLINPPLLSSASGLPSNQPTKSPADSWDAWRIFSHVITFWAPPFLLSSIGGLKDKPSRQAWREKVALCFIAIVLGGTVGFATMGLDRALCPKMPNPTPTRLPASTRQTPLAQSASKGAVQHHHFKDYPGQLVHCCPSVSRPGCHAKLYSYCRRLPVMQRSQLQSRKGRALR